MGVQLLISILVTLSIVASGLLMANAQKDATPEVGDKAAVSQPKSDEKSQQEGDAKKPEATKTESSGPKHKKPAETAAEPPKTKPQPLLMELSAVKDVYRTRDDMMVRVELWAMQPVTVCYYPDRPEANFAVDVYRAGYGKLEVPPTVVQFKQADLHRVERIKLEPGQMHRMVFNVKKLVPLPPSFWRTGEYRMQVKFFLCGKTDQAEIEIPSQGPLHLLVLE